MNVNLQQIKAAWEKLRSVSEKEKDAFLSHLMQELERKKRRIFQANEKDLVLAKKKGLSESLTERLVLDERGLLAIRKRLRDLQSLSSGIGDDIEKKHLTNGLILRKVRVPIGVLLVIYEARPEVTIDVSALCVKTGNAVILKGGSEALHTNNVLYQCINTSLQKAHIPTSAVTFLQAKTREELYHLLQQEAYIDVVIARGGYEMVKNIKEISKIPVLAHAAGGARIYVDKSADLKKALDIVINAKVSKPAACNALDTVVVHRAVAQTFLPMLWKVFKDNNVMIIDNPTDEVYMEETLSKKVTIKIVTSLSDAIRFISKFSKGHSEGIIAEDKKAIERFVSSIDAAAVFVNTSTRFHDGFEFGLGAEMGIATGKLHARGPVSLKELTTYAWEVYGNGQVRS